MENVRIRMFLKTVARESSTLRLLRDDPERIKQKFGLNNEELEALRSADLLRAGELAVQGNNGGSTPRSVMPSRDALDPLDASGTGTITPPATTAPPSTTTPPPTTQPPCEPSGPAWVARFPTSTSTADLLPAFRANVDRFLAALRAAGAHVIISATYRPVERAYLMHYSFLIARQGLDPNTVPPMANVNICWVHEDSQGNPDIPASRAAAEQMVVAYGIVHAPALTSRHTQRRAIDMTITWQGNLVITDGTGQQVTITSTPRTGAANHDLWRVGASYGLIKLASDPPHWSDDGH